jgi:hypothetical protein
VTPREPTTVFVVGCPRSGTTLVGELLASSDHVYNGEESLFLYLMHSWRAMLRPPIAPLTETFIPRAAVLMKEVITGTTADAGKSHFVDHTPWHGLCLGDIWSLFPEAKVIHVVRHPAAVLSSLAHSHAAGYSWAGNSINDRALLWRRFTATVAAHEKDDRFSLIKYEDLCADPVARSRSLFEWVSLPWDEGCLDIFTTAHAANPGRPFTLATSTEHGLEFRPPRRPPKDKRIHQALQAAWAEAERFGYRLDGAG